MAKDSTVELLKQALKEVGAEKERAEADLAKLQEKLRQDTFNVAQREKVQAAKVEIGKICDKYAELARAVSAMSGGTNHTPAP